MQSLRGIRDIHESGVDEHSFSEVTSNLCTLLVTGVQFYASYEALFRVRNPLVFQVLRHTLLKYYVLQSVLEPQFM